VGKPGMAGANTNQRLSLSKPWEGLRRTCRGFEPDSGNLTVRDYRGASRNVRHGEIVTPSCNRKSGNGNPFTYSGARSTSIPTANRARKAETPKQPSLCLRLRAPYFYPDLHPHRCWRSDSAFLRTAPQQGHGLPCGHPERQARTELLSALENEPGVATRMARFKPAFALTFFRLLRRAFGARRHIRNSKFLGHDHGC
jgi:hypothetical protein